MRKTLPIIMLCLAFMAACHGREFPECDNAQLCVRNVGVDTIHYSFGSNFDTDTLYPGELDCISVGEISEGQSYIYTFYSSHGNYFIEVFDCYDERTIE